MRQLPTKLIIACLTLLTLSACSMNRVMVNMSMPMIESGMQAMNYEPDLQLAEDAMPANISMLNGMIYLDPENAQLHVFAAQAFYGLSYGFNEGIDNQRAEKFYLRGLEHGRIALALGGLHNIKQISVDELETQLKKLDKDDVAAIFWTASNWGKWIDLNRDDPASLIQLPKATALMQRVLELDDDFYFGGAHMYFGVYFGSRPPVFGGDFALSRQHFERAREINQHRLLIVDLLHAQYLSRQMFDQNDFHQRLKNIINTPEGLYPELALLNQIARRKASLLLAKEAQWF